MIMKRLLPALACLLLLISAGCSNPAASSSTAQSAPEASPLQTLNDLRVTRYGIARPSFENGIESIGLAAWEEGPDADSGSPAGRTVGDYIRLFLYDASFNYEPDEGTYNLGSGADAGTLGFVGLVADLVNEGGYYVSAKAAAFSGSVEEFEAEFGFEPDFFVEIVSGSVTATKTGELRYTLQWDFETAGGDSISGHGDVAVP
jgi:hypothetical protein